MRKTRFMKGLCAFLAAFVTAAALLPLSGCFTKKYGRGDIEKYVRDKYGIEDFTVSPERKEVKGEDDDYTDYLWTVTEEDGTVFNVLDDYYWGTEWMSNSLADNRNTVYLRRFLQDRSCPGFEVQENAPRSKYIEYITLTGRFTSRTELNERLDTLDELARSMPSGIEASYRLLYDHRYRSVGQYEDTTGDYSGGVSGGEKTDRGEAEKNLLHCSLDLRYEDVIAEYTAAEIKALLDERDYLKIGIKDWDGNVTYYDDLIESRFHYGISFPSMYEVLVRNDYPVIGTKDDFSFTGTDGSLYEFSLDFIEDQKSYFKNGEEYPVWYYYLKDGEQVSMDAYFYNHFHIGKIKELTGINATDGGTEAQLEKEKARQEETLSNSDA